jgi:general L-amino acid transport system permease protein
MVEHYVRTEMAPTLPPPTSMVGVVGWVRENLFSNIPNTILTLLGVYVIYLIVPGFIGWAIVKAVWTGSDGDDCRAEVIGREVGACWAFVNAKFGQFIYGRYPDPERWRVDLCFIVGAAALVPMLIPAVPGKKWNAIFLLAVYPIMTFVLLTGGWFGLQAVETPLWGGLLVTLVVAITGIVASLPLGVLLALGRRSDMPVVRLFCIGFIEFWRGVPLITVLFMASVMLPLFLPEGVVFDKLLRALIGVALFSSAYMAEVVRGGLQAIPRGQYEGAMALGLSYWRMMGLIVLPQALKLVIPGIVNTFIGLFKDTTLVLIIGLFDLLGIIQLNFTDSKWSTPGTSHTGYAFAAMVFWMFCFSMSRYSIFMENRLHTGHKR